MQIKLARKELEDKPSLVSLDKIEKQFSKEDGLIMYFDRDNENKDMMSLIKKFEDKGLSVHFNKVKYGLIEKDYVYSIQVL